MKNCANNINVLKRWIKIREESFEKIKKDPSASLHEKLMYEFSIDGLTDALSIIETGAIKEI
ncbi:hypothetical protein LCGC14_0432550 [marine sediment metagenome]|uniref:Uncharacterized protein n=1 Tax=marine sediment metagenome TaxID=412755 RepID=A0A0F9V9H1_9ZZZZ